MALHGVAGAAGGGSVSYPISSDKGGTGIANNAASTITISGSFASTFTVSGAYTYTFPGATSTLAAIGVAQTWTAVQTFTNSDVRLLGSSTGYTAIASANAGASNYTITVPAVTDTLAVLGANTFIGKQTLNGSSSVEALALTNAAELVNIVAAAPAATTNFYINSGAVQYYTTAAANNWTINFAFSSGTALDTAMAIGDSITVAMLTTQGVTAYYASAFQVDGVAVTPKWQGTAPIAGDASSIDAYSFTILKTASATYTVLASMTKYA